jgi:membrane protein
VSSQGQEGFAIVFSSLFIIISSVVVIVELKESLNVIWGVEPKPGQPIKNLIRDRILAFAMVLGSGLLFLLFLMFDSLLKALGQVLKLRLLKLLPLLQWLNFLPLFIFTTLVFVLILRILPDVRVKWRYLWIGALTTSVLFFIGRHIIGLYLGHSNWVSIYDAAGSLVVLLLWIYYSALIFFFGAELTQVIRHRYCIEPLHISPNAVPVIKTSKMLALKIQKK